MVCRLKCLPLLITNDFSMKGFLKAIYLRLRLILQPFFAFLWSLLRVVNIFSSLLIVGVVIYGVGFQMEAQMMRVASLFYVAYLLFFGELTVSLLKSFIATHKTKQWYIIFLFYLLLLYVAIVWFVLPDSVVFAYPFLAFAHQVYVVFGAVIFISIIKLSVVVTQSLTSRLNPTWIFVGSFALLIIIGAGLLFLPRATTHPIRFIDALFTSVSAVCVTGLTTVDVSSTFTLMGKSVIALLIQLGGIGIMTFTSFFGLFFIGKHLTQNKLLIKDLIDPEKGIGQIFKTLWYIIFVTFTVELIGAYSIFVAIGGNSWNDVGFAVFHSISAFCNAGFSTVSGGLFNETLQANYQLHVIIALLIVIGGLGFPIIFNLGRWLLHIVRNLFRRLFGKEKRYLHIPHLLTSNTWIVLTVTSVLLIGGTVVFYVTEYNNLLANLSSSGKIITAFFMSVTPRTAGFNTFDMGNMHPMTILWMIVLMWIGASPMSTGGGVKTTTIGIAFLNVWHTLRGRNHIELRKRRISETTVNRAFIIIFVSLVVLAIGVGCLAWFEPNTSLQALLFEAVSAFSTVGLSINLTPLLSDESHVVLIVLMFVGRVGLISILSCLVKPKQHLNYQYPSESIPIN